MCCFGGPGLGNTRAMYFIPDFARDHLLFLLSAGLRTTGLALAVALLGVLAGRPNSQRRSLLALVALSSFAYLAGPLIFKLAAPPYVLFGIVVAAAASGLLLLAFTRAALRHDFRWTGWQALGSFALSVLAAAAYFASPPRPEIARLLTFVTAALALWRSRQAVPALSPKRLAARRRFIALAATANLSVVLAESVGPFVPEGVHGLVLLPLLLALGYAFTVLVSDPEALLAPAPDPRPEFSETFLRDFRQVISDEARMSEPDLTLELFAARLGYPVYLVRRYLTTALGHGSFPAFLNHERVGRARRRIAADPTLSLTELAFELGFGSVATFNRAFKRTAGMSPSSFRDGLTA